MPETTHRNPPVSPTAEACMVAVFAGIAELPGLIAFVLLVIGPQPSGNHISILVAMGLAGMISAFVAARLILLRRPLDTIGAGLALGIGAALIFYGFWILVFGVVPAMVAVSDEGIGAVLSFVADALWIVLAESRGIPLLVGILGGTAYIVLKRRYGVLQGADKPPSELE